MNACRAPALSRPACRARSRRFTISNHSTVNDPYLTSLRAAAAAAAVAAAAAAASPAAAAAAAAPAAAATGSNKHQGPHPRGGIPAHTHSRRASTPAAGSRRPGPRAGAGARGDRSGAAHPLMITRGPSALVVISVCPPHYQPWRRAQVPSILVIIGSEQYRDLWVIDHNQRANTDSNSNQGAHDGTAQAPSVLVFVSP